MKTAGIALTALICLITGFFTGRQCLERIKLIQSIILMIKNLKTQIEFSRVPLPSLLEALSENEEFSSLTFIESTAKLLENGEGFNKAWNKAVTSFSAKTGLDKGEINLLRSFANGLGSTDLAGQLSNCDTYIGLFELKLASLKSKSESKVKICNSLGLLSAALVIIVFY